MRHSYNFRELRIGSPRGSEALRALLAFGEYLQNAWGALVEFNSSALQLWIVLALLLTGLTIRSLMKKGTPGPLLFFLLPLILTFLTIAKVAPSTTSRYSVFLLPALVIVLVIGLEVLIPHKRLVYGLLGIYFLLVPRFFSNQVFDRSVGSTFLEFNNPRNGTTQYLQDEGADVLLLIDPRNRWKSSAQIPGLINKGEIWIMNSTTEERVQELLWDSLLKGEEFYLVFLFQQKWKSWAFM